MIQVRKAQLALRRGDVEFLEVETHAILAYLRRYGEETVLILNNLSAQAQSTELDLDAYTGRQPVDLLAAGRLPQVGPAPYGLDLGPNEYRWLRL